MKIGNKMSLWKKKKEKKTSAAAERGRQGPSCFAMFASLPPLLPWAVAADCLSAEQTQLALPQGSCSCCCSFPIIFM